MTKFDPNVHFEERAEAVQDPVQNPSQAQEIKKQARSIIDQRRQTVKKGNKKRAMNKRIGA